MTLFCIPLDERPLDEDLIAEDDPLREWKLTAVMRLMLFNRRCDMIVRDAVRRQALAQVAQRSRLTFTLLKPSSEPSWKCPGLED